MTLSTNQAWWANGHIPTEVGITHSIQALSLQEQLREFVRNEAENDGVFNEHDEVLVNVLQGSMRSSRQRTRSINLSFKEQDWGVRDSFLSPCLKNANVSESTQEMWRSVHADYPDRPFSIECQSVKQTQEIQDPPTKGCISSSIVTVNTKYSWLLVSPRMDLLDCVYISSDMDVSHLECEPMPEEPSDSTTDLSQHPSCHSEEQPSQILERSIARWSIPQEKGYFDPVHYVAQWPAYSLRVNKLVMNILRYASAAAYLRIPIPHFGSWNIISGLPSGKSEVGTQDAGRALTGLGKGLGAVGDVWSKLSNSISKHASETVTREICLGFQRYEHTVKALYAQGVKEDHFVEVVDSLISVAQVQVPDVEELRAAMIVLKYSDNVTWTGETASYTSDDGFHRFFYFYKYADPETNNISIAFGTLSSSFTIAPDVMVVHRKRVGWFGLDRSEEVLYRNVPHVMTVNDTTLLNTYFEVVAYRKLAVVMRLPVPDYPSLDAVCSR